MAGPSQVQPSAGGPRLAESHNSVGPLRALVCERVASRVGGGRGIGGSNTVSPLLLQTLLGPLVRVRCIPYGATPIPALVNKRRTWTRARIFASAVRR